MIIIYYNNREDPVEKYKRLKHEHEKLKNEERQKEEHKKLESGGYQDKKAAESNQSEPRRPSKPSESSKPSKPSEPSGLSKPSKPKSSSKASRSAFDIFLNINRDDELSDEDEAAIKGKQGEQEITRLLSKLDLHGHILNNVYLPTRSGTAELDVIYVNQYGIYVIESKNYAGLIIGGDHHNDWVVQYRKGSDGKQNRFSFYSPVLQNEIHIKHLTNTLPTIDKDNFKSIIVFVDPWKMEVNSKYEVIPSKELNSLIINEAEKENKIFSEKEVDKIYNLLKPYTNVSDKVKKAHIVQAKRAKRYSNRKYFSK